MPIAITEDHLALASTVRGFLRDHRARAAARALLEAEDEPRPSFWDDIAAIGWLGLHVPERYGGSGFGLPELVVVVEELGRAVAPGPFVPTVIASAVLAACANDDLGSKWLPRLADGSTTAALGVEGIVSRGDDTVDGDVGVVLGGAAADVLLVLGGDDALVVPAGCAGVTVEVPPNIDPTRRSARVRLHDVAASDVEVVEGARNDASALARTILAAE